MLKIYLAGTIYSHGDHGSWKHRMCDEFVNLDGEYEFIDPDPSTECNHAMVARDKALIESCDVFVAYIARLTIGTTMETYHAYIQNNIPIIIIDPNYLLAGDIWMEVHAHCIVKSVEEASDIIKSLQ
jgi:nucleoside 2-deoxyribosyltransferase